MEPSAVNQFASQDSYYTLSNVNQTIATLVGVFSNIILLYLIRFISLNDMRILTPLITVHSIIGICQALFNALASARTLTIAGKFFVILTGATVDEPFRSLFLTSIIWIPFLELLLSIVNHIYRYLLVVKDFKPTTFFVGLMCFVSLIISLGFGALYPLIVSRNGPSAETEEDALVLQRYSLWSNHSTRETPDFLVGNPEDSSFFNFMAVIFIIFMVCCMIVGTLALEIHQTIIRRREARGAGGQVNGLKYNRIMNLVLSTCAIVPFLFYCLPLIVGWIAVVCHFHSPHLGVMLSIPYFWTPCVKAVTILVILPQYRKGIKFYWRRINGTSLDNVQSIRTQQSTVEKSVNEKDSKIMY
ncbi:hypothetical protein M3Y94_00854600 [Aphelenchoides besseyi]|nr:hypothetical protein M3Y94_00854600 [Aphelenchoides besseyi]KAI6226797.1 hypothetical protein M3Y95_00658700 [Aphelenchoides besseyi]